MRTLRRLALAAALSLPPLLGSGGDAFAQGAGVCAALPARTPMPKEAVPNYLDDANWRGRVAQLQQMVAGDMSRVGTVFVGDSLTQGFVPQVFDHFFGHRAPLNLGVAGDFTQGVLWRITQGGNWPASLRPRLAVLLIGTNNSGFAERPEDTALGIAEIVRAIRARSPSTRVLIVGITPRGADSSDPLRRVNIAVNALIARCADNSTVFYADPGRMLVDAAGRLPEHMAGDRLHLTMVGYAVLAAALEPTIARLLNETTIAR